MSESRLQDLVAGLAEEVAIGILADYRAEEYIRLDKPIEYLAEAKSFLESGGRDVPLPVAQIMANRERGTR